MSRVSPSESLVVWTLSVLGRQADPPPAIAPVAGDASSRRYFRAAWADRSYVLVEAPPQTEKNEAFLALRQILADAGVRVPAVLGADLQHGYMLLEDLGDRLLLAELNAQSVDSHYQHAFEVLRSLLTVNVAAADRAASPAPAWPIPAYDEALLAEELGRFDQWYVANMLGHTISADESDLLQRLYAVLIEHALAQPTVLVHRDFHSRNLMLTAEDELAVIDFQDAVAGPLTYDLVSLLRDCYIRWPAERVTAWALQYLEGLPQALRSQVPSEATFLRWTDFMGLQRHIKVLGTFARLHLRDNKPGYLRDLPLVQHYTLEMLAKYAGEEPVFAQALHWYREVLSPRVARQSWSTA